MQLKWSLDSRVIYALQRNPAPTWSFDGPPNTFLWAIDVATGKKRQLLATPDPNTFMNDLSRTTIVLEVWDGLQVVDLATGASNFIVTDDGSRTPNAGMAVTTDDGRFIAVLHMERPYSDNDADPLPSGHVVAFTRSGAVVWQSEKLPESQALVIDFLPNGLQLLWQKGRAGARDLGLVTTVAGGQTWSAGSVDTIAATPRGKVVWADDRNRAIVADGDGTRRRVLAQSSFSVRIAGDRVFYEVWGGGQKGLCVVGSDGGGRHGVIRTRNTNPPHINAAPMGDGAIIDVRLPG